MKEATGELNITVITVIAIAAVGALFYMFVWPTIQRSIADNTCKAYGTGWHAVKITDATTATQLGDAKVNEYACCPEGVNSAADSKCVKAD